MTTQEKRRWIKEWFALKEACAYEGTLSLTSWSKEIVPGREGEFSLMLIDPEAGDPLIFVAIPRELGVFESAINDWAHTAVDRALKAISTYIEKELWRGTQR